MRSKLNPDGSKIRSLRIQRGWTQDQLADIAGISPRTVQRAETADSAAFETVRAIAGAFETDFDQLLKHNAEPIVHDVERAPNSAVGIEPIALSPAKSVPQQRWAMFLVAVSTLFLGVVAGVIFTYHFNWGEESDALTVPAISARSPQVDRSKVDSLPVPDSHQSMPSRGIPAAKTQIPNQYRKINMENPGKQVSSVTISAVADPDPGEISEPSHLPESLHELVTRSKEPLPALVISESSSSWSNIPIPANNPKTDEPDSGVLREAMNTAVKKTGAFVSKAGESIKRVF